MGKYRSIRWFKHETINKWLKFEWLRIVHFSLLFSNKGYQYVNRHHIKLFNEHYSDFVPSDVENRVLSHLERDGIAFANISEFFGPDMLVQLKERFDRLVSLKGEDYMNDTRHYNKVLDLNGDLCDDESIRKWVMCRAFINIASLYLELVPRCATKQEYIVIPTENTKTGAQLWHRDNSDKKILKVFVYLNDVEEANGPFKFLTGTHFKGILRDIRAFTGNYVWAEEKRDDKNLEFYSEIFAGRETVCSGKAGTVIFADTSGLHRGGFCVSGSRSMIELSFYSNAAFISHGRYKIPKEYKFPEDPVLKTVFGLN